MFDQFGMLHEYQILFDIKIRKHLKYLFNAMLILI